MMINIQQQFYMNKRTKYCQFSLIMAILWYYKTIIKYGVMKEIWKNCEGYKDWYQVSNKGRVRSWKKPPQGRRKEPYVLSLEITYQGYKRATLHRGGNKIHESVHRLVARAFIPNPENKDQINHKDGDKGNNIVENLEWCTQSENRIHALENGMVNVSKGERHYRTELTNSDIKEIRRLCNDSDYTQSEIGDMFGLCQSHVSDIKNKKKWKHVT